MPFSIVFRFYVMEKTKVPIVVNKYFLHNPSSMKSEIVVKYLCVTLYSIFYLFFVGLVLYRLQLDSGDIPLALLSLWNLLIYVYSIRYIYLSKMYSYKKKFFVFSEIIFISFFGMILLYILAAVGT